MRLTSVVLPSWISSITSKISWIVGWPWSKSCVSVCVSVCLCLSVIDSTNWCMGRKNKYWYFLSGNMDFGLEKSWKNYGTFFWDFCGNPDTGHINSHGNQNMCYNIYFSGIEIVTWICVSLCVRLLVFIVLLLFLLVWMKSRHWIMFLL